VKILWHSNAPHASTGYGVQTALFAPRLKGLGHDVTISANYGLEGSPRMIAGDVPGSGMVILPAGHDPFGNDALLYDNEEQHFDITITLYDTWVYEPGITREFRWCPWTPVDHYPLSPRVRLALVTAFKPIAYSRFGQETLKEAGYDALYVPHGVDTEIFYPVDKREAREEIGADPDVFMVGIVAANKGVPSRKAFDQQIRAFAQLYRKHPDSVLYLHTELATPHGEEIDPIVEMAGLPGKAVAKCDQYKYLRGMIGQDYMRKAYSAMDVLLNCTKGEGFGLPIIEAQACGTPAIVTDCTAMSELSPYRVAVDEDDRYYSQSSYQWTPKVSLIARELEAMYAAATDGSLSAMEANARDFALGYDANLVTEQYWTPALEHIARMIEVGELRQVPVVISSRAVQYEH